MMVECCVCISAPTYQVRGFQNDTKEVLCKECLEGYAITTFQQSILSYFSNTKETAWEFQTPLKNPFEIHDIKGVDDDLPVWGTAEWILTEWVWFGVRCAYHMTIALTIEIIREGWILVRGHNNDYGMEFREANVSHRLTPLFKEYYGMRYNAELKPTMEKRVFNWIRSSVGLG